MVWRTTLITICSCFLLGTTFSHWIADHDVLWKTPITTQAVNNSITYYSLLSTAPRGMGWAYIAIGSIALLSAGGRMWKVFRTGKGEIIFDGGSVVLLAATTYTQISEVFPSILLFPSPLPSNISKHPLYSSLSTATKELASDNIKTAVMLTGVMLLQAGRYYAKRPSRTNIQDLALPSLEPAISVTSPLQSDSEAASPELSPVKDRAGTPYRELSESEAMEMRLLEEYPDGGDSGRNGGTARLSPMSSRKSRVRKR